MRRPFAWMAAAVVILIAALACIFVWIYVWHTPWGYELRTVGQSERAAVYAGVRPRRIILVTLCISGALAGLVGVNEIMGLQHRLLLNFNAGYGFTGIAVALMGLLVRSPFGHTLRAIRENERRARFLAIPVERQIWLSFSISCFFTALAGTLYALLNNFADPLALHYSLSGYFVVMCVMGGMRTFWGPLVGAAVFVVLQDYISSVTVNWMSFVGAIFVLVVLFFPRGLLGMRRQLSSA